MKWRKEKGWGEWLRFCEVVYYKETDRQLDRLISCFHSFFHLPFDLWASCKQSRTNVAESTLVPHCGLLIYLVCNCVPIMRRICGKVIRQATRPTKKSTGQLSFAVWNKNTSMPLNSMTETNMVLKQHMSKIEQWKIYIP